MQEGRNFLRGAAVAARLVVGGGDEELSVRFGRVVDAVGFGGFCTLAG
jgi:hypothetical protein